MAAATGRGRGMATIELRNEPTVLDVVDDTVGNRIYSTGVWQGIRAMFFVRRYRHLAHDHQRIVRQIVARHIADGDWQTAALRQRRDIAPLRRAIRQRDYWVEVAHRIFTLSPHTNPDAR